MKHTFYGVDDVYGNENGNEQLTVTYSQVTFDDFIRTKERRFTKKKIIRM